MYPAKKHIIPNVLCCYVKILLAVPCRPGSYLSVRASKTYVESAGGTWADFLVFMQENSRKPKSHGNILICSIASSSARLEDEET